MIIVRMTVSIINYFIHEHNNKHFKLKLLRTQNSSYH